MSEENLNQIILLKTLTHFFVRDMELDVSMEVIISNEQEFDIELNGNSYAKIGLDELQLIGNTVRALSLLYDLHTYAWETKLRDEYGGEFPYNAVDEITHTLTEQVVSEADDYWLGHIWAGDALDYEDGFSPEPCLYGNLSKVFDESASTFFSEEWDGIPFMTKALSRYSEDFRNRLFRNPEFIDRFEGSIEKGERLC